MAKKPKPDQQANEEQSTSGVLTTTAKAIGTAAGKIASLAGVAESAPVPAHTKSAKPAKLEKKNRSRLPRREKKAQKKAAMANQPAR